MITWISNGVNAYLILNTELLWIKVYFIWDLLISMCTGNLLQKGFTRFP